MSRMLEALRQIEAKRPPGQQRAKRPPVENHPLVYSSVETPAHIESETKDTFDDYRRAELTELHPDIQEEIDRLSPAEIPAKESFAPHITEQYPASDSSAIDDTLARAESAVGSALAPEEPDVFEEITQYILTQLTPGRPAALAFTSPQSGIGQTALLSSLSKKLERRINGEVFVFSGLLNRDMEQDAKTPRISGDLDYSLEKMTSRCQLVLVDAPCLTDLQATAVFSSCDGVYLLLGLGYTTPYDLGESVRVIQQSGGRLLGCIAVGDVRS
jgi:hypothetical protein